MDQRLGGDRVSDISLRFALLLAVVLSASGCDKEPLAVALNSDVVKGWSYATIASATFDQPSSPAPAPAPNPGGKCETCNGTGKVGDGRVFTVCQDCGGDGIAEALQVRSPDCACDDCKCEDCKCSKVLSLPGATALGDCPGGVCSSPGAPRAPVRIMPRLRLFRR